MIMDCDQCNAFVDSIVIGWFEYLKGEGRGSGRFLLAKCTRCGSPLFVWQNNIGNLCEGDIWDTPVKLYPLSEFSITANTPALIKETYDEATRCFESHSYNAVAILCRKALEGTCVHYGIHETNLDRSLQKMKSEGIIDDRLFQWADMLRITGNAAVHEIATTISKIDAKDMLEFTNAIIDYLFSFRDKFEEFKKRRQS